MNLLESLFSRKNEPGARRRVPLFVRITITLLAILALLYFVIGGVFLSHYKESLAYGELDKGWLTLSHLSSAARTNLLEEDSLSLSVLTADYAAVDAVLYTTVVDHTQSILAHSDPSQVGNKYSSADRISETIQDPQFTTYERSVAGQRAYELSQPLRFQDKYLGTAYLGLSQNYINDYVDGRSGALLKSLFLPFLILLLLVLSLSLFLTAWIKFPLYKLLLAIQGICRGDFNFPLDMSGNNELSDLASEVKHLSNNLRLKEQMKTDVADYLNCTSLDRILEMPRENGSNYASRRQVTILYAGIAGFGEYASHTKAEEVVEALNEYIGIATNTILAHGGYVDKFLGDAVVGIFGVSVYREDHTRRAVKAAWELQAVLRERDDGTNRVLGKVRIGMSSGVVLSGNIGSVSRIEYSSIGESIKEAFWLNGLATEKEIIISKSIYQIIKDDACVEPLTPQKLIGHDDVLESYRLQNFIDLPHVDPQETA